MVQSLPADAAKITALAREGDNLRAQLQALQSQLDATTQAQTSVVGPNFIEYPQINFSNQDEDVVVEGTTANRITEDLNVSIYYRTQGIKGSSPMGTWRRAVTSIGTVSKAIKGAEITPIAVLHKIVDHYVIGGDTTGFPLNAGEIAYIRLDIGNNNQEQHIYFQVIWSDPRHALSLISPALTMNWAAAWEQQSK